jgi:hypothetical protein
MRGACALALMVVLVLCGADGAAASARLHAFSSCSSLLGYAQRNGVRVIRDAATVRPAPPPESVSGGGGDGRAEAPVAAPAPAAGDDTSSQTNVQEAGVDEPDWVKLSGTTLFALSGGKLVAFDASGDRARVLGSLDLNGYSQQLLVRGDRALVIASVGFGGDTPVMARQVPGVAPAIWIGRTRLLEVDVSKPGAMRVLRTLDVEGSVVSARLTGATARVVIRTDARGIAVPDAGTRAAWTRSVRRTRTRAWLPSSVLRDRVAHRVRRRAVVRCRQVRRPQQFSGLGTITVLTIDMDRGLPAVDADSLMASGETVYASTDRLYVASERWLGEDPSAQDVRRLAATSLHAFSTTHAGETTYVGSGEVDGYLLSQWSLSEYKGVLRVATTSLPPWDSGEQAQSAVRMLVERSGALAEVGSVDGLGRGERIYAVRYIGDTAFVVTFRQVDPLYTVDLSDPRAPRVVGTLKVPGYSAYLHPLGDDLLLGIGQDATEAGRTTGVKLSVFDVSDLRAPRQVSSASVGRYSYTDAEYDHHAFLWWGPARLAVLPVTQYAQDFNGTAFGGAIAYRVSKAGAISETARFGAPGAERVGETFSRAVVVGTRLLLVSGENVLTTFVGAPGPGELTPFPR